jgi:hypothetical protein
MLRNSITSVGQVIDKIAHEKRRAGKARFKPRDPNTEAPSEVYKAACAAIAAHFPDFRYAKTGPRISRKASPLTFEVSFQSSHNNVAGEFVALRIGAGVHSDQLKKWRQQQPNASCISDHVAGGLLGNLREPTTYLEWDLADPKTRLAVIDDAAKAIHDLAIPYFARFANVGEISHEMIHHDLPGTWIRDVLDFLLCFREREDAEAAATNFLKRRPGLIPEYEAVIARFKANGLPKHGPSGYSQMIAWAAIAYNLRVRPGAG